MQHILPIRVYYEDTDLGGIVHHSNYIKFFERARIEAFRTQGFELSSLLLDWDAQFVVHSLDIQYLHSATLDQLLYIVTKVTEVRYASIRYNQAVHLETLDGPLICKANIILACVCSKRRPRRLPKILLQEKKG